MLHPREHPLTQRGPVLVRSTADQFNVHVLIRRGDEDSNRAVVDILEERYGDGFAQAVPDGAEVHWHEAGGAASGIKVVFPGRGYHTDPEVAAPLVAQTCLAWLELTGDDPVEDLDALVAERVAEDEDIEDEDEDADAD
jgi:hypothetical protein